MLKMKLSALLAALSVGRTILPPYTGSEDQPHSGNHFLLTARVMEIQSLLDPRAWRYCPGSHNPADLSRVSCGGKGPLACKS